MESESLPRRAGLALLALVAVWPSAAARGVETVECWRGWGYLSDPVTQAYVSGEMLLVTRGAADWRAKSTSCPTKPKTVEASANRSTF